MEKLSPFRLRPWFRTRVWGVRDLTPWYDYKVQQEPIGEVWLSGDDCIVDSGPLAGQRFQDVFRSHGVDLVGAETASHERFPLLMKVLFPKEDLSLQVHPGDTMAREEGEPHGKTECWYALEADPGATVALGLKPGTTQQQMEDALMHQQLQPLMEHVPVSKGDMIFVDAGTIHAVGPGVVLLETQQNSDMTYRLYDYGRPRELHLDKGLKASRVKTSAGKVTPHAEGDGMVLVESNYFRVDRYRLTKGATQGFLSSPSNSAVQLIFLAHGSGVVQSAGNEPVTLKAGELAIIPACTPEWTLEVSEPLEMLRAVPLH